MQLAKLQIGADFPVWKKSHFIWTINVAMVAKENKNLLD